MPPRTPPPRFPEARSTARYRPAAGPGLCRVQRHVCDSLLLFSSNPQIRLSIRRWVTAIVGQRAGEVNLPLQEACVGSGSDTPLSKTARTLWMAKNGPFHPPCRQSAGGFPFSSLSELQDRQAASRHDPGHPPPRCCPDRALPLRRLMVSSSLLERNSRQRCMSSGKYCTRFPRSGKRKVGLPAERDERRLLSTSFATDDDLHPQGHQYSSNTRWISSRSDVLVSASDSSSAAFCGLNVSATIMPGQYQLL